MGAYAPQGDQPPPARDQGREEEGAGAEEEEADDAALGTVPVDERADGEAGCWGGWVGGFLGFLKDQAGRWLYGRVVCCPSIYKVTTDI